MGESFYFICISSLGYFFCRVIDKYLASVVKLTFVPVSSVINVRLSGSRINSNLRSSRLIMRSSLISSGAGLSSFRMCHF